MKVFMLGCANERGEVVSMNAFLTEREAQKQMELEFDHECNDVEQCGYDIESKECGSRYAEMVIDVDDRFYRWNIYKQDIKADPSAIVKALRQSMGNDIDHIAQAPVPGYDSCRPAVIDLRGEEFNKLSFGKGEELIEVEAYIPMAGLAVIVKCADGVTRPAVVGQQSLDTDELLELHTVVTGTRHPVRVFNPYWLMDDEWHATLMGILNKTDEEYQKFISNNPKNKQNS